jgi:hypothetical protein
MVREAEFSVTAPAIYAALTTLAKSEPSARNDNI